MPKNCSADVQRVVQYVDNVVASGNGTAISQMAQYFGISNAGSVEAFLNSSAFFIILSQCHSRSQLTRLSETSHLRMARNGRFFDQDVFVLSILRYA